MAIVPGLVLFYRSEGDRVPELCCTGEPGLVVRDNYQVLRIRGLKVKFDPSLGDIVQVIISVLWEISLFLVFLLLSTVTFCNT